MKSIVASLFLIALICFGGAVVFCLPAVAQEDDLEALFDEGINLYKRGRLEESLTIFQNVLAQNPSNQLAFEFWNKTGHQIFLQMLIEKGEYESVAKRFIELARVGRKEKEEDGDRIAELVGMVVSGDQRERTEALLALMADHGEYTVEYIYPELASDDLEVRVKVITGLARMGEEIVLPLIQVLHSDDVMIRRGASAILGYIKDARALPALAMMAAVDADELNRDVAVESIKKIVGSEASGMPSPTELYLDLSEKYLKKDDRVLKAYLLSRVIWKWRDGALTKTEVHPGIYNLELAEDACYQALSTDTNFLRGRAMLALIYAAQKAEVNAERTEAGDDDSALTESLIEALVKLAPADRLVGLAGPSGLNLALEMALEGGYNLAAVELIKVMSTAGIQGTVLDSALNSKDKKVRYTAAVALANGGIHTEPVVGSLVSALRESAIREVLVIDDQSDSRNALVNDLNEAGFFAVSAETGAMGLVRAKGFPLKDLVIVRVGIKDIAVDKVVYELAKGQTSEIPIMFLADELKLEGVKGMWEGKVAGFISSPPSRETYLPAVQDVVGEALNPEREMAQAMSLVAGEALTHIQPEFLATHMDGLVVALDKPDLVKIPVLDVLARIGDPAPLEKVKSILGDEGASIEVRIAAAHALGAMFAKLQAAPDNEVLDLLASVMGSDDSNLASAAGAAIGKAVALPDGFMDRVLKDYRID